MKLHLRYHLLLPFLFSVYFAACGGWVENRAALKTQAPEEYDIPQDLVVANIAATDYTAIVHLLKARVEEGPAAGLRGGYVTHVYRARVLETIRGRSHVAISYAVMADSDIKPFLPDYPVIVSLCEPGRGRYHVPDNGSVLPATPSLAAAAREA